MTGTGTQSDPYIVSDWEELVTACNSTNNYIVCESGIEVDFNDIYPNGYTQGDTAYSLRFNTLIGNGLKLKNLLSSDDTPSLAQPLNFVGTTLRDIHVRNFVNENSGTSGLLYFYVNNIYDCTFELAVYASSSAYKALIYQGSDYKNYRNCSFFILCNGNSGLFYGVGYTPRLYNCLIHYENDDKTNIISASDNHHYDLYKKNNCLIEGNVKCRINTNSNRIYLPGSAGASFSDSDFLTYSIYNVTTNIPDGYKDYTLYLENSGAISLVNIDKIDISNYGQRGTNVQFLTDEQMKNPTYIAGLGFPIRA